MPHHAMPSSTYIYRMNLYEPCRNPKLLVKNELFKQRSQQRWLRFAMHTQYTDLPVYATHSLTLSDPEYVVLTSDT